MLDLDVPPGRARADVLQSQSELIGQRIERRVAGRQPLPENGAGDGRRLACGARPVLGPDPAADLVTMPAGDIPAGEYARGAGAATRIGCDAAVEREVEVAGNESRRGNGADRDQDVIARN